MTMFNERVVLLLVETSISAWRLFGMEDILYSKSNARRVDDAHRQSAQDRLDAE